MVDRGPFPDLDNSFVGNEGVKGSVWWILGLWMGLV